jgi:hypothetical protein
LSISLFTGSVVGYIHVPVVDPRIATHKDVLKAVDENERPAATEVSELTTEAPISADGSASVVTPATSSDGI